MADVEKLAKEGKLRDLAGFGEKSEQNILKGVEVFKKSSGRFHINVAEAAAVAITAHIQKAGKAVESVTPAGSLRRGKETVGRSGPAVDAGRMGTLRKRRSIALQNIF